MFNVREVKSISTLKAMEVSLRVVQYSFFRKSNQTYRISYSCIFDLQYTKVLNNGISFYPSNLFRVKFKVN